MAKIHFSSLLAATVFALAACTPKYDWREVRGTNAPYTVALPAKPSSMSRPINLDGLQFSMTMTAAEVDGVTFAVGSAELPDAAKSQIALNALKTALVKNIGGTLRHEKASDPSATPTTIDIEAVGSAVPGSDQARLLIARFVAKDRHVYQLVVAGKEKSVSRDAVDTFLTSFKLN